MLGAISSSQELQNANYERDVSFRLHRAPIQQQVSCSWGWRRIASMPSRRMMGTMTRAARGSAHHQPKTVLRPTPVSAMADKYAQNEVGLNTVFGWWWA